MFEMKYKSRKIVPPDLGLSSFFVLLNIHFNMRQIMNLHIREFDHKSSLRFIFKWSKIMNWCEEKRKNLKWVTNKTQSFNHHKFPSVRASERRWVLRTLVRSCFVSFFCFFCSYLLWEMAWLAASSPTDATRCDEGISRELGLFFSFLFLFCFLVGISQELLFGLWMESPRNCCFVRRWSFPGTLMFQL